MKLLVISTVWIEPSSSAAGSRMLQILDVFLENGWEIVYASTAGRSEYAHDLSPLGICVEHIMVNDESFNVFVKECHPNIVLFDRFMSEEQFGWRVTQECPNTLKILDTEDLHCLRKARQVAVKEHRDFQYQDLISDIAKREIASIYRSDLTIMISSYEMELLQTFFKVPEELLCYIPFLAPKLTMDFTSFQERQHFISIGNFLHAPNWDATLRLKNHIWPLIRKELPQAELHIYGAYPSEKVWQLQNVKEGFYVKGRAERAKEVISAARVLLAPLRFGAGLKGKLFDAMQCGTPSVTTTVGAEAMQGNLEWGGAVANAEVAFAKAAIHLYTDRNKWKQAQENGRICITKNFQKTDFAENLITRIKELLDGLESHRQDNFTGQMLLHHTMRSTMFMSKWIEEKNK